jgi:hypothetical protein
MTSMTRDFNKKFAKQREIVERERGKKFFPIFLSYLSWCHGKLENQGFGP